MDRRLYAQIPLRQRSAPCLKVHIMFGLKNSTFPALPLPEAIARAGAGEVILIDVRDHAELAQTGQAKGALHIPLSRLPMVADPRHPDFDPRLSGGEPIAIYCASGARSGMAANVLKKLGYSETHNLGGLRHWIEAGGEVSR